MLHNEITYSYMQEKITKSTISKHNQTKAAFTPVTEIYKKSFLYMRLLQKANKQSK